MIDKSKCFSDSSPYIVNQSIIRNNINLMSIFISLIFLLVISPLTSKVYAFGFGIYGDYLYTISGSFDHTGEEGPSGHKTKYIEDARINMSAFGAGFTLDTAVAKNSAVNYRLNVGFVNMNETIKSDALGEISFVGWGAKIENILGIGLIRLESFRLWLGPDFTAIWIDQKIQKKGKLDINDNYVYNSNSLTTLLFSLGLAVGFNLHLSETTSLCIYGVFSIVSMESNMLIFKDHTFSGSGYNATGNVSIIFRGISDRYSKGKQ